jgi:hypothetical protein
MQGFSFVGRCVLQTTGDQYIRLTVCVEVAPCWGMALLKASGSISLAPGSATKIKDIFGTALSKYV